MAWILTIEVPTDQIDAVSERLWELGTTGVAEVTDPSRVLAGFDTRSEARTARSALGGTIAAVDPAAWAPTEATLVTIGGRSLTIDAGQSFGHGAHPTTRLCLRALETHVQPGHAVLDVGCGSGVLSLAAAALGAGAVTAIDIDPAAIRATQSNAAANDLAIDVSPTPLSELNGPFDLVVVNMLISELEPISDDVIRVAAGVVIVSGALVQQAKRWSALFPEWHEVSESGDGEWVSRTYRIAPAQLDPGDNDA